MRTCLRLLAAALIPLWISVLQACADAPTVARPGSARRDVGDPGAAQLLVSAVAPNTCAAVVDHSTQPGAAVITWACDSAYAARRFALQPNGQITTHDGKMCLDVLPPKAKTGGVVIWGCYASEATQHWTLTPAGELTNVQGLCLTIAYEDAQPGRPLVLWTCDGSAAQRWTFGLDAASASGSAELPRVYLNTAAPAVTGRSIAVPAGGDLQGALDAAQPGDEVVLAAGATYTGNFTLRPKAGMGAAQWITVRSSGALPPEGTRVGPGDAAQMPKILTPNSSSALATAAGAQGWRLTGLEIAPAPQAPLVYALIALGGSGSDQNTAAQVPSRLVLDRSYVHGTPTFNLRRCVLLNSAATAIIESYLADCHSNDSDSQGILGFNGPGPYRIVNNHIEGGHQGIMFGGADPTVPGLVPSDIEIRRNHVMRPLSWRGVWQVKNLLELKAGQRVLVEANVLENNWAHAQNGFALLWWSLNADGNAPWTVTQDVTFRYNVVRNTEQGFNLSVGNNPGQPMQRVTIVHNLITGPEWSGGRLSGAAYQLTGAIAGLTIANNSGLGSDNAACVTFVTPDEPLPTLVFRDNVSGGRYTLFAGGAIGGSALERLRVPAANVTGNVFAISDPSDTWTVPPGNSAANPASAIGFADLAGGDLTLLATSPYLTSGTGGSRPGANVAAVSRMTQGVVR